MGLTVGGGGADKLVVVKVLCRTFFVFNAYMRNCSKSEIFVLAVESCT